MKELADKIAEIFYDYHSSKGYSFTSEHVITWVSQFDEADQQFILEELLHLLNQGIYVSEAEAREMLIAGVQFIANDCGFKDVSSFLKHTDFLNIQPKGKSQDELLQILEQELIKLYSIKLSDCGTVSQKYAIYVDDIIATGGTAYNNFIRWLNVKNTDGESNFQKVISKNKILFVMVFCFHEWVNIDWRLKMHFSDDAILKKIKYLRYFPIENHPTKPGQKLNFAYPNVNQPQIVEDYLSGLTAKYNGEHAYRKVNRPAIETFFSSPENRIRFENILLMKGIALLNNTVGTLKENHRPMGATTPSKKILGTGTMFFTWRNISNTTPIVFWWGAHWYPLFPLSNRGT